MKFLDKIFQYNPKDKTDVIGIAINIARDFSKFPGGRYSEFEEGKDCSAERFKREFLYPAFKNYDKVTVILDKTMGFGSPWLQAAFENLWVTGYDLDQLKDRLTIISDDDSSLILEIWQYIESNYNALNKFK